MVCNAQGHLYTHIFELILGSVGIDIDWEYPGSQNGNAGNQESPQDSANLLQFLKLAKQTMGQGKLLTMATALTPFNGPDGSPMTVRDRF
jgi:chitinase